MFVCCGLCLYISRTTDDDSGNLLSGLDEALEVVVNALIVRVLCLVSLFGLAIEVLNS